jgi:hypothetical protein
VFSDKLLQASIMFVGKAGACPIEQHILDTNAGKQQSEAATDV